MLNDDLLAKEPSGSKFRLFDSKDTSDRPAMSRHGSTLHHEAHAVKRGDIANKSTILAELDAFHGHAGKPPAVEFVLVETVTPDVPLLPPISKLGWGGWGFSFGHAACRYTRPDGVQRLVNITKGTGAVGETDLVEFWEAPEDYLFGVRGEAGKGGIFSRPIALIRIPVWDDDAVMAIDYWFKGVMSAYHHGRNSEDSGRRGGSSAVGFNLFAQVIDALAILMPGRQHRRGNCANWTSQALFFAGLLERTHGFPKATFVDLFENLILDAHRAGLPPGAKVTYLRQAPAGRAERTWQVYDYFPMTVAPLMLLKNFMYRDLEAFADAVVEVVEEDDDPEDARPSDDEPEGARPPDDAAAEMVAAKGSRRGYDGPPSPRLVAKIRAGRAFRPSFLRCGPCASGHHIVLIVIGALWICYGWPNLTHPRESMYMARVLFVLLLFVINAILT